MSTNNFEDSKNGIFVIEEYEPLTYEEWLEGLDDGTMRDNPEAEHLYQEYAEDEYGENLTMAVDDTIGNIVVDLESKGYGVTQVTPYDYKVTGNGMWEQIGLHLENGYYASAQVIVTTQRDEQFTNANVEEEDVTVNLYEFVDEQGYSEYTDDISDFNEDPDYRLSKVLYNVLWHDDTYEQVLDDMLPDDKVVLDVVSQYTTPLKKIGNFSNGEALYEKA